MSDICVGDEITSARLLVFHHYSLLDLVFLQLFDFVLLFLNNFHEVTILDRCLLQSCGELLAPFLRLSKRLFEGPLLLTEKEVVRLHHLGNTPLFIKRILQIQGLLFEPADLLREVCHLLIALNFEFLIGQLVFECVYFFHDEAHLSRISIEKI